MRITKLYRAIDRILMHKLERIKTRAAVKRIGIVSYEAQLWFIQQTDHKPAEHVAFSLFLKKYPFGPRAARAKKNPTTMNISPELACR